MKPKASPSSDGTGKSKADQLADSMPPGTHKYDPNGEDDELEDGRSRPFEEDPPGPGRHGDQP